MTPEARRENYGVALPPATYHRRAPDNPDDGIAFVPDFANGIQNLRTLFP